MDEWVRLADHWQTLISGILAIIAALFGAGLVYHQTRQTRAIEEDRLQRRHAAARSTLPLVLSSIMNYARQVGAGMRQLYLSSAGNHVDRDRLVDWDIPAVPPGETAALANVIEAASNDTADVIADLLGHLQVQSGRIREMHANTTAGTPGRRNILKPSSRNICSTSPISMRAASCCSIMPAARRKRCRRSPAAKTCCGHCS